MPQASDSSYAAVTRHRVPFSIAARPPIFHRDDHKTWTNALESDDLLLQHHDESITEEEDPDAVAPAGTSSAAASSNQARLRREEGWNDLGLDTVGLQQPLDSGLPAPLGGAAAEAEPAASVRRMGGRSSRHESTPAAR